MRYRHILFIFFSILISAQIRAQKTQPAADILREAYSRAAAESKQVFVLFTASWCGWCHKMDMSMNDPSVKRFFDDNYVTVHLTVYESENNQHLENPGAVALLEKYYGADLGIPYWLIFDKDGNLAGDSKLRKEGQSLQEGDNTGCPASAKEVAHFIQVLKKTSRLTDDELTIISALFRKNEN